MLEIIQDRFSRLLESAHPAEVLAAELKGVYTNEFCESCIKAYGAVRDGRYHEGLTAWDVIHDQLAELTSEDEDLGYIDSLRALCLSRLGYANEAHAAAARSVLLAPHLAATHLVLAMMYLEFDNHDQALREFTRAREIEKRRFEAAT